MVLVQGPQDEPVSSRVQGQEFVLNPVKLGGPFPSLSFKVLVYGTGRHLWARLLPVRHHKTKPEAAWGRLYKP